MNALRVAMLALALTAVAGAGASSASAAACKNATVLPERSSQLSAARAAVLCLVNRERTKRGLVALTRSRTLEKIGIRQSKDMVRRHYFDHTTPSGKTFPDRMRAGGWLGGAAGENIAWGTGSQGTPASIVDAWMQSAGHRANILHAAFRLGGVGVVAGTAPVGDFDDAATYTMDYGAP